MPLTRRPASILLISILCAACVRAPVKSIEWPTDLPPLAYYEHLYEVDQHNQTLQTRKTYLLWVKRFYWGWNLYQDGWHETTKNILLGVRNSSARKRLEPKLARLGKLISGEWAKQSEHRAIYTRELSIWGQALLKYLDRQEQEKLVDRVIRDVNALLSGDINRTDINLDRYVDSGGNPPGES